MEGNSCEEENSIYPILTQIILLLCEGRQSLCGVALGPTLSIGLGLLVILQLRNGYNFQVKAGLFPNRHWIIFRIISTFISSKINFPQNICGKHILISCLLWQEEDPSQYLESWAHHYNFVIHLATIINFTSDSFNFLSTQFWCC